jgi:hypothetical protein
MTLRRRGFLDLDAGHLVPGLHDLIDGGTDCVT